MVAEAFIFDGSGDYVATANDPFSTPQIGTSGSMDAWVNFSSLPPSNEGAIATDIEGWVHIGYGKIDVDPEEKLKCRLYDVNSQEHVVNTIVPQLNRWYHVVVTWDGANMKCYVDGLLRGSVAAGAIDPDTPLNTRPFSIGAASHDPSLRQFHGLIDEVEVFDRVLTAGEIKAIDDAGRLGKIKPIPPVAGDVNGDGVPDFIVGAFNDDPAGSGSDAGSAYVFSGADGSLLYQVTGDTVADNLGHSVSGAGDVNGDGKADFIVGASLDDPVGGGINAGSAYVFSGANGSLLYQVTGDSTEDRFGFSVGGAK